MTVRPSWVPPTLAQEDGAADDGLMMVTGHYPVKILLFNSLPRSRCSLHIVSWNAGSVMVCLQLFVVVLIFT
jgi:hypothetical protein